MKKKFLSAFLLAAALVFTGTFVASCDDDDDDVPPPGSSIISFENVTTPKDFVQSGTFAGTGSGAPAILPGESVSFKFNAGKGQALMFAAMYAYSNDVFFAPENPGIKVYTDNGTPITGNVSSYIKLWDNGTRVNQAPGPDVTHPGTGTNGKVTMINGTDPQGNIFPSASAIMKLELAYDVNSSQFTATLTNISGGTAYETPISAGVWVVANILDGNLLSNDPFYAADITSSVEMTALAENGNQTLLANKAKVQTGIITTLSPALVVTYTGEGNPIYELGKKDAELGLRYLAQKGDVSVLKQSLSKLPHVRNVYVAGDKSINPGNKSEVQFEVRANEKVAYALMFGYSNDWFYSNATPIDASYKGDLTGQTILLDDGTAVNQYPGAGNAQYIFGGTPIPESNVITKVTDNVFPVPAVTDIIRVTIR